MYPVIDPIYGASLDYSTTVASHSRHHAAGTPLPRSRNQQFHRLVAIASGVVGIPRITLMDRLAEAHRGPRTALQSTVTMASRRMRMPGQGDSRVSGRGRKINSRASRMQVL